MTATMRAMVLERLGLPTDAAITFAPSGDVVHAALRALGRGGKANVALRRQRDGLGTALPCLFLEVSTGGPHCR